jgi:hypothetical protein
MLAARWIRLERNCRAGLRATITGFALAQSARAAPAVFWARDEDDDFSYALAVPLSLAPGRAKRWCPWALAPSIATYRQFGERAYLDGDSICLAGRKISAAEAAAVGGWAVMACRFLARPPSVTAFWTEANVEEAFRGRIEAQHGWQFDHSWPSTAERAAMGGALAAQVGGAAN